MGLSKLAKGWRKGAVKGNAEDQHQLAGCYDNGCEGVKRDLVAATAWWHKAAELEHVGAQLSLGACYARGAGVERNFELAATFYRKAAEAGHAAGQGLLGGCYSIGRGVQRNEALAVEWWEKAATGGDADSQASLGLCYMRGKRGLPQNARRARSYLKAAAAQGHGEAIENLKLLNACESCGAPDANRTCGGCRSMKCIRMIRYCSAKCQKKDWKFHKLHCCGLKVCECRNCRVSGCIESSTAAALE